VTVSFVTGVGESAYRQGALVERDEPITMPGKRLGEPYLNA